MVAKGGAPDAPRCAAPAISPDVNDISTPFTTNLAGRSGLHTADHRPVAGFRPPSSGGSDMRSEPGKYRSGHVPEQRVYCDTHRSCASRRGCVKPGRCGFDVRPKLGKRSWCCDVCIGALSRRRQTGQSMSGFHRIYPDCLDLHAAYLRENRAAPQIEVLPQQMC